MTVTRRGDYSAPDDSDTVSGTESGALEDALPGVGFVFRRQGLEAVDRPQIRHCPRQPPAAARFLQPALAFGPAGDIDQEVDRANEHAGGVEHGRGIRREARLRAVGPAGDGCCAADRLALPDRDRHRALVVRQEAVVLAEKLPGDAPAIAIERRHAPSEIDAGLVVVGDQAFCIGDVQGAGKVIQGDAIWPRSVRDSRNGGLHDFFGFER
jgi:hypothetical protein